MKVAIYTPPDKIGHNFRGIGNYINKLTENLRKHKNIEVLNFVSIDQINDVDLIHYPYFDFFNFTLPLFKKYPTVVTIHDVIPLLFPRYYPAGIRGNLALSYQKISLKNVEAIITDSICSKGDIIKKLSLPEKKIFSVYLAPGEEFKVIKDQNILLKAKNKYDLPNAFVLYVGDVNWNKNLIGIIEACSLVNIDIVLVGKAFEKKENLSHIELKSYKEFITRFSDNPKVHVKGFVPSSDLVAITNLAKVGILVSFYEGFGLPILEAQACGVPMVCSNVGSMPEVAGEGALFVDPKNIEEISKAILKIFESDKVSQELVKKGSINLKRFSWEKTVDETIEVYKYASYN